MSQAQSFSGQPPPQTPVVYPQGNPSNIPSAQATSATIPQARPNIYPTQALSQTVSVPATPVATSTSNQYQSGYYQKTQNSYSQAQVYRQQASAIFADYVEKHCFFFYLDISINIFHK